jgi:hypothetical protein
MSRALIFSVPLAACLLLAVTLPGVAAPAAPLVPALPQAWSSPVNVLSGQFFELSAAVDSTGAVHIAAAGRNGLWYITNRSGSWVATRILVNPTNKSYQQPSIALNANDRVFIAFSRSSCDDCAPGSTDGIFLLTDKGRARGTFPSTPTKLTPATTAEPSLVIHGGHIYLAYQTACCEPGPLPPLRLKTNASGSWTVSQIAAKGDSPSLQVASNGNPRVAYTKPSGIGFAAASSMTGGFSSVTLPGTTANDTAPVLALAPSGRAHMVWIHSTLTSASVRYSTRVAGAWTTPAGIVSSANLSTIAFTLDSANQPSAAIGTDPGSVRLAQLVGSTWVKTTISAADALDVAIALGGGHLAVVYSRDGGGIFVTTN